MLASTTHTMTFGSSIITKTIHIHHNALLLCCNLDHILPTAKTKFVFVIDYDLDPPDLTAMKIDIYDRIKCNIEIKIGVYVCGTFGIMLFVIDSLLEFEY